MSTGSQLISDIRTRFGDSAGNYLTDALVLTWLDNAQSDFVDAQYPLIRTKAFTVAANADYITAPSDKVLIDLCVMTRGLRRPLKNVNPVEWEQQRSMVQNAVGYPVIWTEKDGRVYFWPRFSSASANSTLSAATLSTTATTILMATTSVFSSFGRGIVDSEEFSYNSKDSTSLIGVTRGEGGTTATSHASSATVYLADVELTYRRTAVALATNTSPEIPTIDHSDLEYYALYMAYTSEGSNAKAEAAWQMWEDAMKRAKFKYGRKSLSGPLTVKDINSQRLGNLYGPV